jgi:hypothetical protein
VVDVSAAFLQTAMPVLGVLVLLHNHIVDRLLKLEGLPELWAKYRREDGTMVVECDRAWYGGVHCCQLWNAEINNALVNTCGYTRHSMVPCVYYRQVSKTEKAYIMLFVDDLWLLTARGGAEKARVIALLEKDFGELSK